MTGLITSRSLADDITTNDSLIRLFLLLLIFSVIDAPLLCSSFLSVRIVNSALLNVTVSRSLKFRYRRLSFRSPLM